MQPLSSFTELPLWLSIHSRPLRCIRFPTRPEAQVLVTKYVEDVRCLQHITSAHWLLTVFNSVYDTLEAGSSPPPSFLGSVALLLSMFIGSTFFWTEADVNAQHGLFSTTEEARRHTMYWCSAFRDLLQSSCSPGPPSLHFVQAVLFVSCISQAFPALGSARHYLDVAISMARELGIYRCEDPGCVQSVTCSRAERQVECRTWCFLVSLDW